MTEHGLDNPVWSSLTSLHRALALGAGAARRYPADVAPFLAVADNIAPAADELAALVGVDEPIYVIGDAPAMPAGWRLDSLGGIVQMICEGPQAEVAGAAVVPLIDHGPAVLELAALVYPHYVRSRTMLLGRYFGIFEDGQLAAMIGERMGMPGFREISAVCTHPAHVGRGLARRLLAWLGNDILASGATPFLHVSPSNERAVQIYERSGFRRQRMIPFGSLVRAT